MRAYATQAFQTNTSTTTTATATATSASTTVTSSAAFPSALVGAVGGFSVLINGVQYTSAILTSTSSMTLATPYAGSTGSVTVSFNAVAENVQAGTPGSGFTSNNGPARFAIPALAICSMCRRLSCPQRQIHRQTTKRNTFWATIARMAHRWARTLAVKCRNWRSRQRRQQRWRQSAPTTRRAQSCHRTQRHTANRRLMRGFLLARQGNRITLRRMASKSPVKLWFRLIAIR